VNRIWLLVLAAVLAAGVAVAAAYLVVVSQNPASAVPGPSTVYGSVAP
jgi:hypothetical protein